MRVIVATTEGPVVIRRITPEDPNLRSVVCLAGTSQTLPISKAYDAFVRAPTGVVERAVGHPVFRVDVDRRIDDGESWQLGVYLAHRLKAVGRLAENEEPADAILWATGRIDHDGRIGGVGRVEAKLRRSEELFASSDTPVLAALPVADQDRFDENTIPDGFELMPADHVDVVSDRFGLADPRSRPTERPWALIGVVVAVVVAVAIALSWPITSIDLPPSVGSASPDTVAIPPAPASKAFDPSALTLSLEERRVSAPGLGCDGTTNVVAVEPGAKTAAGVCALRWSVVNTETRSLQIWLYAVIEGAFREYASRTRSSEYAAGVLEPGERASVTVAPPSWLRRPAMVRVVLVVAASERPQIDHVFSDIDLASADDLDRKVAGLLDLDVHVVDRRHRLIPPLR